jgi:hypothetical protein
MAAKQLGVRMSFPAPLCAKCYKRIDDFSTSFNPHTRIWTLTATCHGETASMAFEGAPDEASKIMVFQDYELSPSSA